MLQKIILFFIVSLLIASCVSQSEKDRIVSENEKIALERDRLKEEMEELKFGAPNLLSDGKQFYDARDFLQARQKFELLIEKHPEMPQSIEAKNFLIGIDEEELWDNASSSEEISILDSYLNKYPKGKYKSKAAERRKQVKILNLQKAYDYAAAENTSTSWKNFITEYPNHNEASEIKRRIIRLEVDEISGDRETGKMPSFDRYDGNYTSSSTVRITNNTGCDLTVRYSGPDVEIIIIPSGSTRSMNLASGNYKLAASACGANYAGTESLKGEYRSTFYISTTRY